MAQADSSWMHNPKHSWQPACVDNLGQPQPNRWQAVRSQKCSHLSKGNQDVGCSRKEGIPPQPTLQCYPNPLALPLRPCWSQGAPSRGTSVPHRTPFSVPLLMRASPTRREDQQTGSEHAVGFIWGISRQRCCCLGTLTEPCALSSSCVWGATRPPTKSQLAAARKEGKKIQKAQSTNQKASCPACHGTWSCWQPFQAPMF